MRWQSRMRRRPAAQNREARWRSMRRRNGIVMRVEPPTGNARMVIDALVETITRLGYACAARVVCPLPRPTRVSIAIDFQRVHARRSAHTDAVHVRSAGHDVGGQHRQRATTQAVSTHRKRLADASATAARHRSDQRAEHRPRTSRPRCTCCYANANAERLLKMHTIFRTTVAARARASRRGIERGIAQGESRKRVADASAALQLRDDNATTRRSAPSCCRLRSRGGHAAWPQPPVLLAMNELMRSRAIPDRWLFQMFGLTPAEASVANWLVSGRTIDAVRAAPRRQPRNSALAAQGRLVEDGHVETGAARRGAGAIADRARVDVKLRVGSDRHAIFNRRLGRSSFGAPRCRHP